MKKSNKLNEGAGSELENFKSNLLKTKSIIFEEEEETPGNPWNDSEFYFAKPVKIQPPASEESAKK